MAKPPGGGWACRVSEKGSVTTLEQTKARPRRFRGRLLTGMLFLILLGGTFVFGAIWTHRDNPPQITTDLISQQLVDVQELATVDYYYTNMGRYENQLNFYGWQVPFTTKRFIVSYDGVIKAGIDLSELRVSIQGTTITVHLPEARILSHEIPEDSIEIFDETHNIFNQISLSDYTGFAGDQREAMEQRAIEGGLLTRAQERARSAVTELLTLMPGMDGYTLKID